MEGIHTRIFVPRLTEVVASPTTRCPIRDSKTNVRSHPMRIRSGPCWIKRPLVLTTNGQWSLCLLGDVI